MAKNDPRLSFKKTFGILEQNYGKVRAQAIINTVKDIRSRARRGMKQANKSRTLKSGKVKQLTGEHSAPGEPPYRRTGGLYNSIIWDRVLENRTLLKVVVGPTVFSGQPTGDLSVPAVLEKGGTVRKRVTEYQPSRSSGSRVRIVNKRGDLWSNRPFLARATKKDRKQGDGRYTYFYTTEAWERATKTPGSRLIAWFRAREKAVEVTSKIAPRPYMAPAVKYETSDERWTARVRRAASKG